MVFIEVSKETIVNRKLSKKYDYNKLNFGKCLAEV